MSCLENCLDIIPIVVAILLYLWSYYIYMIELCWKMIKSKTEKISYGIVFNILFSMMMWCYFETMCTVHDRVPILYVPPFYIKEAIRLSESDDETNRILKQFCSSRGINLKTTNSHGYIRYCHHCKLVKPDRAHHCSTCETCILKMDHHCPWVGACIGYSNYKNFILYLFYTCLYLLYTGCTMVQYCIIFLYTPHEERDYFKIQLVICCGLTVTFGLVLLGFFIFHLILLFSNETTIESMADPTFQDNENLTFNIEPCFNFLQVFGYDAGFWFIPIGTIPGNGVTFYTTNKY